MFLKLVTLFVVCTYLNAKLLKMFHKIKNIFVDFYKIFFNLFKISVL